MFVSPCVGSGSAATHVVKGDGGATGAVCAPSTFTCIAHPSGCRPWSARLSRTPVCSGRGRNLWRRSQHQPAAPCQCERCPDSSAETQLAPQGLRMVTTGAAVMLLHRYVPTLASGVLGFPRGMPCSQEKTRRAVRSPSPAAPGTAPADHRSPTDHPGSVIAVRPPGVLPQSPDSASAPSQAKLPLSLGATEATYGPHRRLRAHLPCAPRPRRLASPVPCNRHRGVERAMPAQEPGSGCWGAPQAARAPPLPHPGAPVLGRGWEQGRGRTERYPAPGRKVCKESTEHRLPGVSEGKFMHRL